MIPFNFTTVVRGILLLTARTMGRRLGLRRPTADNPQADLTPRPGGQPPRNGWAAEPASGGAEDIRARLSDASHPAPTRPPETLEEIGKRIGAELNAAWWYPDGTPKIANDRRRPNGKDN